MTKTSCWQIVIETRWLSAETVESGRWLPPPSAPAHTAFRWSARRESQSRRSKDSWNEPPLWKRSSWFASGRTHSTSTRKRCGTLLADTISFRSRPDLFPSLPSRRPPIESYVHVENRVGVVTVGAHHDLFSSRSDDERTPNALAAFPGSLRQPADVADTADPGAEVAGHRTIVVRSEEHTSELQSPCNLVCRL